MILRVLFLSLLIVFNTGWGTARLTNSTSVIVAPTDFYPTSKNLWYAVEREMETTNAKYITIYWEGTGGNSSIGDTFINSMQRASNQGKVIKLIITGQAISMHAIVTCFAPNVVFNKGSLTFHQGFHRDNKGHKRYVSSSYYTDYCVNKGVLTAQDRDVIVNKHMRVVIYPNGSKQVLPDWR